MPTENQKQFATPSDCLKVVENIEQAGALRSRDRALINGQFNGARPYTDQEVEENQIQVNVNQLGGYRMAMDANSQVNGALLNKDRFFSVRCVGGNSEKQEEWGQIFTRNIHLPLKRGRSGKKHLFTLKNRNASLTLHGIGALLWTTSNKWLPKFVSLDDLLIPTDATVEFSDELGHFGVNIYMTPWQLRKLTSGEKVDKGWNLKFANRILTSIPKAAQFTPDTLNRPEQFESLWKQHAMFMNSDAVPKIKLTFFFYQDPDSGKCLEKCSTE